MLGLTNTVISVIYYHYYGGGGVECKRIGGRRGDNGKRSSKRVRVRNILMAPNLLDVRTTQKIVSFKKKVQDGEPQVIQCEMPAL